MKKNKSKLSDLKTKSLYLFVVLLTLVLVQTSCGKNEEEVYELAISESSVSIAKGGGSAVIAVTASEPWGAVPDENEPWCDLVLTDTRLTVICSANKTGSSRSASIYISTAHKSRTLRVYQSK
jgi:hypothetical protein